MDGVGLQRGGVLRCSNEVGVLGGGGGPTVQCMGSGCAGGFCDALNGVGLRGGWGGPTMQCTEWGCMEGGWRGVL